MYQVPTKPHTHPTDHDLDHLDSNLPFWGAVQDLYSIDPTQKPCPRSCRLYGSHPATWGTTADHTRTDQESISALKGLDYAAVIDYLSDVLPYIIYYAKTPKNLLRRATSTHLGALSSFGQYKAPYSYSWECNVTLIFGNIESIWGGKSRLKSGATFSTKSWEYFF